MSAPCPHCGGVSSDAEFCSECGASMAPPPAQVAPGGAELCPVCGEARPSPFARYCDTCRYDFLSKQPFAAAPPLAAPVPAAPVPAAPPMLAAPMPDVPQPPDSAPQAAAALAPPSPAPPGPRWDLHAAVDPSLRREGDPAPTDARARIFPLDLADHLVGRRSDSEDIHPEVVVNDPGISRRHVRILRAADGALSALDLGSMNGTRLNGAPMEPNVPTALQAGDQLTLGCWTRLTVTPR